MKLPQLILLGALVMFGPARASHATVLLDDTWADGNRTTQNLPTDSAWYASSGSALTTTTGSMTLAVGGTAIMALTYFTSGANVPVQLGVGDTLIATVRMVFSGLSTGNGSQNFRIAVSDYVDSTLSPKRASGDFSSNDTLGSGVQSYALFQNMGSVFNGSSPMQLRKRSNLSSAKFLGSSSDWTTLANGPGSTNGFSGFVNGTAYTLQFSLQRTNSTTLVFTVTWVNTATGARLTTSYVDTAATNFNFDGIALRPSDATSTASTITFTEAKVEVVASSTPPSIDIQPVDQAVLVGQSASFSVLAGGTAPLSYQWYYNTNTVLDGATNSALTLTNVQTTNSGVYSVVVSNAVASIPSSNALLLVNLPIGPSIVTQPQSQTVLPGETAMFSVVAGGSEPLSFQWYYNTNFVLTNATDATLSLVNVQPGDAGVYSVVVSNAVNAVDSLYAVLTVNTSAVAPVFTSQPVSVVALTGGSASFSAIVFGTGPLGYQWKKDGAAISNATSAALMLTNLQLSDAGSYTLSASNSVAVVSSDAAILTVTPSVPVAHSAYNLTGFGQGTTGGGVLADSDANYAKVYTATDLANAVSSKTVKIIEIMNDLDLGYNEIEAAAKANSEPFRAHNAPKLHPRLLVTGVSLIDIQKKNGLTIFSANGATVRHATFNIKSSGNVIVRNLKFDEMWEWDEASKGDYDKNDWDFMDLGNSGTVSNIWIDHCTFTKAYDGICDIKSGSFNITFSWNKYTGDDGATNPNSFVRQQINSLESNKTSYAMYNFLRNNGFSVEDIVTICQGHDKTHLVGATTDSINAQHTLTFHHQWYMNPWDRLPRLRGGNVHNFNIYVDDTLGLAAKRLRDSRAAALSTANQNTLNNTYSFNPFLNGSISTEGGAMLTEKSVYIDCLTPLRNNQTDPSDPFYTGKIQALDTIYQMDNTDGTTTLVRGNSTDPGNPLGPFQAPSIAFSWNLPGNQLPYSYTLDDPSQVKAIVTSSTAGAGAGVLTWAKSNWLTTAYAATAPFIVADPQSQSASPGDNVAFVVVAGGSGPLSYQWYFNTNSLIAGATNATLTLGNVQGTNAGAYSVLVSNSVGSAGSAFALVTVSAPPAGFASWQAAEFSLQQLNNPAISGPDAMPAGDGVPNFAKYALGLAPLVPATESLVTFRVEGGDGVLCYHRPMAAEDVGYHVRVSTDLTAWTETGVSQQVVGTDTNGLQIWEVRYTGPASTACFFQLLLQR